MGEGQDGARRSREGGNLDPSNQAWEGTLPRKKELSNPRRT